MLQLDEPSLPAVLGGRVGTPSGYGTVRAVEATTAEAALRDVLSVADLGARVVHSCAADVPFGVLRNVGADAISFDLDHLDTADLDTLGELVDAGVSLWPGVLPATDPAVSFDVARTRVRTLWTALSFPMRELAGAVVPTPACGLAGASPDHVRAVLRVLGELAKWLPDAESEGDES